MRPTRPTWVSVFFFLPYYLPSGLPLPVPGRNPHWRKGSVVGGAEPCTRTSVLCGASVSLTPAALRPPCFAALLRLRVLRVSEGHSTSFPFSELRIFLAAPGSSPQPRSSPSARRRCPRHWSLALPNVLWPLGGQLAPWSAHYTLHFFQNFQLVFLVHAVGCQ